MKHSWQELEDGTAKCRRCPAVRVPSHRVLLRYVEFETLNNVPYTGNAYDYEVPVAKSVTTTALVIVNAHPTKCGRPA